MGNSLQDQLLKAGLVDEQKLKQARTGKRKKHKKSGAVDVSDQEERSRARQAAAQKAARDRELNRQQQEEARRKAEANELRQLIHTNRLPRRDGDVPYSFQDGQALKRIYVTAEQQRGLAHGRLAIVRQDTGYEVIPAPIADRVRARNAALILLHNRAAEEPSADDDYADYKVPDDLMW
ncbi:MAG: DUF2058 domain-containing protein [Chromatiaceae bacterium]